jgi:hypothetical protein
LKIDVLGTKYTILELPKSKDKSLESCDGYCDKTSKKIVITTKDEACDLECFEVYRRKILRHEIIHAFLFESGLHENFRHPEWGHEETMIDWVAAQFPKLVAAFKAADCL